MCVQRFSSVPDTRSKSPVSVSYFKMHTVFFDRIISAGKELRGIDQNHSFLFSLHSVSCFGEV